MNYAASSQTSGANSLHSDPCLASSLLSSPLGRAAFQHENVMKLWRSQRFRRKAAESDHESIAMLAGRFEQLRRGNTGSAIIDDAAAKFLSAYLNGYPRLQPTKLLNVSPGARSLR